MLIVCRYAFFPQHHLFPCHQGGLHRQSQSLSCAAGSPRRPTHAYHVGMVSFDVSFTVRNFTRMSLSVIDVFCVDSVCSVFLPSWLVRCSCFGTNALFLLLSLLLVVASIWKYDTTTSVTDDPNWSRSTYTTCMPKRRTAKRRNILNIWRICQFRESVALLTPTVLFY